MNIFRKLVGGVLALIMVAFLGTWVQAGTLPHAAGLAGHRAMAGPQLLGLRQILRELDLSDAQRQSIRGILSETREQARAERRDAPMDLIALGNPSDPNHAAAVATAKVRAEQRVEKMSAVQKRIYAVLTPEQQAKLPQLLSDVQQRRDQRRSGG